MKHLRMFLLILFAPFVALSASAATCTTNSCTGTVSMLYVTASGSIYVNMTGGMSGLNCTLVSSVYATLVPSATNANYLFSSLLAAETTGRSVIVRFDDNSTGCTINYANS